MIHSALKRFVCLIILSFSCSSFAVIELLEFDTEVEKERYQTLIDELRCPKCQNQNLADSDSQIAIDLRQKVRDLMDQGKNDEEIKSHLVARYGDFVLYRPEVKEVTYLLWYGPAVFLFIGFIVVVVVLRRNKQDSSDDKEASLSEEERQERIRQLMNKNSEK
ncbi:cytochrome c-type biogenesis protein [Litoribacillus peritrichatus]|uniref:Cytochrome c-type biogenesis protein n=1 Tax=Litoribacillus peritrichatus TaxID=718191 RepID=A0ABP7M5F5_9GAMM